MIISIYETLLYFYETTTSHEIHAAKVESEAKKFETRY